MNISTRITEYSITGGLLWVSAFLFATVLNLQMNQDDISMVSVMRLWGEWISAMAPLSTAFEGLSNSLQGSISTLLAALAIIVIFFSGIILDLLGPVFFISIEMMFFHKWLVTKNRPWLDQLIADNREFIGEDYRIFIEDCAFNWKKPFAWFERRRSYNKLWTFMLSQVMVFSKAASLEELMDRVHLWRTSRAISTSMVVLGCLLNFTPLVHTPDNHAATLSFALTSIGVPVVLFAVSALITLGTYSRMSIVLCSLVYTTTQQKSAAAGAG